MKLKYNEDNTPVIANGHPIYVGDDGREVSFDAAASIKRTKELESALLSEQIGTNFYRSKFVAEKLTLPAELIRATFAKSFKLEKGEPVAVDKNGNTIYSRLKPGHAADFDEALELLIDASPHRDSIVKKSGTANGNASGNGSSNDHGGHKTMSRRSFEELPPVQRMAHIRAGGVITDG
jgi:hypothetical protein